jgi:hypothetical protein
VDSWGKPHHIIDAENSDIIKGAGLLKQDDFWGMWQCMLSKYCTEEKVAQYVNFIDNLDSECQAKVPPNTRRAKMTWHSTREVPPDVLLFPRGQSWYAQYLNHECQIVLGDTSVPVMVSKPVLIDADRIQVSEVTFVEIVSRASGAQPPTYGSHAWHRYIASGVQDVEVRC